MGADGEGRHARGLRAPSRDRSDIAVAAGAFRVDRGVVVGGTGRRRRGRRRDARGAARRQRPATARSFGYMFLVCATGKSAAEMLALLRARLAQRAGHRAARRRRGAGEDHPPAPGEAVIMSPITTHVLDTALGRPAVGLRVRLDCSMPMARPTPLAERVTNDQGRITDFVPPGTLGAQTYRLTFDTGALLRRVRPPAVLPARRHRLHGRGRRRAPPHPAAPQPLRLLHLPRHVVA